MLEEIFQMIISPELQTALLPLKIVIVFLCFLAFAAIVYWLFTTSYLRFKFLDSWSDYRHWKAAYSPKAIKQKVREREEAASAPPQDLSVSTATPEPGVAAPPSPASLLGEPDEEINFKDGRVERSQWDRIMDKLDSGNELNYKLALIDADKMLNDALKKEGRDLSSKFVSNVEEINKVKQFLEKMLESPGAKLSLEEAKKVIAIYQKALSELKAIFNP